MNHAFTWGLYALTGILLILSLIKSRKKTALALKKAGKLFLGMLPLFLAILFLIGLLLAVTTPEIIQSVLGSDSGAAGLLLSALLGSVSVIPVLIAFPISAQLLQNGAGLMQIALFISTLTTVGFVTMPIEIKYLGKKVALLRNMLAFICSFGVAFVVKAVLG